MARDNHRKIKILKLLELLRQKSDEQNPLTTNQLISELANMDIPCDRRTLSQDIATLNEAGYEVMSTMVGHEKGYYVGDRRFSIPELKIILDAIHAAAFITDKKSEELIGKVADLAGTYRSEVLKRNMVCFNTRKHSNEHIYYTVDVLEEAILTNRKVIFRYFDLNERRERVYRRGGHHYVVEPIALVYNEDNYYLMVYSSKHDNTGTYRIDRMESVEIIEEPICEKAIGLRSTMDEHTEQYGYLKSDLKAMVDQIVMELAKDERIQNLYDLWYEQREAVLSTYTDTFPERIPLEQNKEFKSIRNAVIREAMKITDSILQAASQEPYRDVPEIGLPKGEEPEEGSIIDPEYWKSRIPLVNTENLASEEGRKPPQEEKIDDRLLYRLAAMCILGNGAGVDLEQARRYFEVAAEQGNVDALYGLGRLYLRKDYAGYDTTKAIEYLEQSADKDNAFAKYQLGKLLCEGEVCDKDIARGLKLLEELWEKGVSIAAYLAGKVYLREKDWQDIKK